MRAFKLAIVLVALINVAASAEEKKGSDPNKLPVGSLWEGTFRSEVKKDVVSDELTIKITKREGGKFEGEWHQHNKKEKFEPRYEMEGVIAANNRVTITLTKLISGKDRGDKIGNMKITAQLANNELEGTAFIPETKVTMTWNVKLKKD